MTSRLAPLEWPVTCVVVRRHAPATVTAVRDHSDVSGARGYTWVRSSRSAASGWRRRSIASCSSAPASSAVAPASSLRDRAPDGRGRVVLVTGVSRDLRSRFARTLAAEDAGRGRRSRRGPAPARSGQRADFVRADIRNPLIAKVIATTRVDTVVHLAIVATPASAGGRSSMKEINVIGTMQLLAACQKAETFRKLVVQSSVSVYGASPRDPAKFTEDMSARAQPRTGFGKDSVEIESYVRGLARRRPDVVVTTLRLANLMGAGVDSHVTRYLSLAGRATGHGFRRPAAVPASQDARRCALLLVTTRDVPGTFNVAAADIVTLSQALRDDGPAQRSACPSAAAPLVATLVRQARLVDFSADQIDALTYGRGMDTAVSPADRASFRRSAAGRRWRSSWPRPGPGCSAASGSTARSPP